jgi:hypothetical protein
MLVLCRPMPVARLWDVWCGLLLVTAGVFKTLLPGNADVATAGLASMHASAGTIAALVEVMLGIALVCGLQPGLLRPIAGILFGVFSAYSLHRSFAGFEHCGCFGALSVPPWLTTCVDIVAAAGLLLLPAESVLRRSGRVRLWATIALVATVPIFLTRLSWMPWVAATVFGNNPAESIVLLSPADWVGKPLPIASSISPRIEIADQTWDILLFHHSCPKCREVVDFKLARAAASHSQRLLLLEVPPYGREIPESPHVSTARLDESKYWFVSTPVLIRVTSGTVTSVTSDFD